MSSMSLNTEVNQTITVCGQYILDREYMFFQTQEARKNMNTPSEMEWSCLQDGPEEARRRKQNVILAKNIKKPFN